MLDFLLCTRGDKPDFIYMLTVFVVSSAGHLSEIGMGSCQGPAQRNWSGQTGSSLFLGQIIFTYLLKYRVLDKIAWNCFRRTIPSILDRID